MVYAALGGFFFLFVAFLQISMGYSPIAAGAATLPVTALMLVLSARAGAVALLPLIAGLTGDSFYDPASMTDSFRVAMLACAGLAAVGGILAWLTISLNVLEAEPEPDGTPPTQVLHEVSCGVPAPLLRPGREAACHPVGTEAVRPATCAQIVSCISVFSWRGDRGCPDWRARPPGRRPDPSADRRTGPRGARPRAGRRRRPKSS
jgi:hypothetical protein